MAVGAVEVCVLPMAARCGSEKAAASIPGDSGLEWVWALEGAKQQRVGAEQWH